MKRGALRTGLLKNTFFLKQKNKKKQKKQIKQKKQK